MERPIAVLVTGHQRTGTSVFRAELCSGGGFHDCGELFTVSRAVAAEADAFPTFLRQYVADPTQFIVASYENRWAFLDQYLKYLKALYPEKTFIFDVKYDYIHNMSPASWLFTESPLLFEYCKNKKIPVLNFVRRNLLAQYCSLQYGLATGKWHYTRDNLNASAKAITIDPSHCNAWLAKSQLATDIVRTWLRPHTLAFELEYEQLYANNRLAPKYVDPMNRLLGGNLICDKILPFEKTPVNYREMVENFEDVKLSLAGTPFAWMPDQL